MQTLTRVMPIVVILTLAAAPEADGQGATPPLEITTAMERIPLPSVRGPLALRVDAYESTVALEAPRDAAALAGKLGKIARTICPTVLERAGTVLLRCRSRRLSARLVSFKGGRAIDVRELVALPWDAEDQAPPLTPFDPVALGLGGPCPGDTPAGRAECALAQGRRDEAEQLFREALPTSGAPFAEIRLGDLALAAGDVLGAVRSWRHGPAEPPWTQAAHMRLCDLDPKCLDSPRAVSLALDDVPRSFRTDTILRAARREAFQGRALEAAATLAVESGPDGACANAAGFCRRILLAALRESGQRGARAFALFLDAPSRDRGPYAVELARAAADRAEEAGAPAFAANLMAVVAGKVHASELPWHLLRTAELYFKGGDRARAQVVAEFARVRLGHKELRRPRWQAILHGVPRTTVEIATRHDRLKDLEADLAAAQAALATVRASTGGAQ